MIGEYPFEWSKSEGRYGYLSREESAEFDEIKNSDDPKDKRIVELLEESAESCRADHCSCRY